MYVCVTKVRVITRVLTVVGTILLRNIHTTMKETTRSSVFHLCSIGMWSNCLINPLIYASKVATVKVRSHNITTGRLRL